MKIKLIASVMASPSHHQLYSNYLFSHRNRYPGGQLRMLVVITILTTLTTIAAYAGGDGNSAPTVPM
jgi:hypothetical protein